MSNAFEQELAAIFARMKGRGLTDAEIDEHDRKDRRRKRIIGAQLYDRPTLDREPADMAHAMDVMAGESGAVMVLCGARGTGKTSMAREVQWARIDRDRSAGLYVLFSDVVLGLKPLYGEYADKRENAASLVRERLVSASLAILDEVHDALEGSKVAAKVLNDLVIRRHAERNDTILITNRPKADIGLDDSILSRASENGLVFEPPWASFRGRNQEDGQEGNP